MNAQIIKTYFDGSFDIDTMDVDTARIHVKTRTDNADSMGIAKIDVRVEGACGWFTWTKATRWTESCSTGAIDCQHTV